MASQKKYVDKSVKNYNDLKSCYFIRSYENPSPGTGNAAKLF